MRGGGCYKNNKKKINFEKGNNIKEIQVHVKELIREREVEMWVEN